MTTDRKEELTSESHLSILLDSKYPLLQKFRESCPGSYKHSQYLESMIEGVATELGLNIELMKVAALFHDVGKMLHPKLFTENQLENEENIHDKLEPWVSYELISRHVSDSVMILINDSNFPRIIIEIVGQHHGTGITKYFFVKAKGKDNGAFRYKTPKPKTVEAAVLMICDKVEATARSLVQANKFEPNALINKTIEELIDDEQLDDITMRLGDLKKIKKALANELEGMHQKRVDYDKAKE